MSVLSEFNNRRRGDEFYTQYADVEKEMRNYDLAGMVVYCNCDNPDTSKFVAYFMDNFESSGIRKLMATFNGPNPFLYEYDGINERKTPISSGLFQDNLALIRKCDIVITNPPFSGGLPVKLIQMLVENGKKFIIVAPLSLIQKKVIFDYVKTGQLSIGNNTLRHFDTPSGSSEKITAVWWTNMQVNKEKLNLTKKYDERLYPKYDNFDAIDSRTNDIPGDYHGYIGVPISFIFRFNPAQFDLVGILNHPKINGKGMMSRIIIKRKGIVRLTESDLHGIIMESVNRILGEEIYTLHYDEPYEEGKRRKILEEITDFFKWIFGNDFELRGVSVEEGEILPIDSLSDKQIERFFTDYLKKQTVFYNPRKKILYSYKPKNDWYFKKAWTNAWSFKYIFYPLFVEGWGGWYRGYTFKLYEKEDGNLYHFVKTIE